MKRFTVGRLLLAILLAAVFSVLGLISYQIGNYYSYKDAYSGHIVRRDKSASRDGLKDLQFFYELDYLPSYLSKDADCERAAYYNLDNDLEKTINELRDKKRFCASFLRGVATWRQAQAEYANALTLPDKTPVQKKDKLKQLKLADEKAATLAKDDFEAALKANPDHAPSSWDHDLLSNPENRAMALMPKPGKIKIQLGQSGGGKTNPGPLGEDGKGEGKKSKDIDTNEEGPGRPDGKPKKVG